MLIYGVAIDSNSLFVCPIDFYEGCAMQKIFRICFSILRVESTVSEMLSVCGKSWCFGCKCNIPEVVSVVSVA